MGFGVLLFRDGSIKFCEPLVENINCSHSYIINRLEIEDNENQYLKHFVRAQFISYNDEESFDWDEQDALPACADTDENKERMNKLFRKVSPFFVEYETSLCKLKTLWYKTDLSREKFRNGCRSRIRTLVSHIESIEGYVPKEKHG